MGWDPNVVDVMLISMTGQVIHAQVILKDDNKVIFCSFVYAHNSFIQRRILWQNLGLHKAFVHDRPWCILGDFNVALHLDDRFMGSSNIDIAMCEFSECVDSIELNDVKSVGMHFTWNQKPSGGDGLLKKN